MKKLKVLAIMLCPLLLMGCASISTGTHQRIPINTTPSGATVTSNTGYSGVTPCVADLKRSKEHTLTIKKKGYDAVVITLTKSMCGSFAGNLVVGGFIGLGVDAVTGAMWKLQPEEIDITLNKLEL